MKYFLHDTSSFDDEKVTMLYMKFGYEGLGLFYTALEKMAKLEKPVKTTVLKAQLRIGKRLEKCWTFMEEIGIIQSKNGETFNKELLNFSEKYQIKKEKTRKRVSEWRDRQDDEKDVTGYECVSNARKVKESKVKEKESIERVVSYYNEVASKTTNKIPRLSALTDDRKGKILARIKEYEEEKVKEIIDRVDYSDFLSGREENERGWKADIGWIMKKENAAIILEGQKYGLEKYEEEKKFKAKAEEMNIPLEKFKKMYKQWNTPDYKSKISFEDYVSQFQREY